MLPLLTDAQSAIEYRVAQVACVAQPICGGAIKACKPITAACTTGTTRQVEGQEQEEGTWTGLGIRDTCPQTHTGAGLSVAWVFGGFV